MTDYLRDPNNLDPTGPEAYEWPTLDGFEASGYLGDEGEAFKRNSFAVRHHPAYDDSYLRDAIGHTFVQRFMCGVGEPVIEWRDPEPITVSFLLEADQWRAALETLLGSFDTPICLQELPSEGVE